MLATSTAALAASSLAYAQQAEKPLVLDDIIVTATRTEQRLQTVPIAVSAQSGADLVRKGVTDVSNLQFSTPSINVGPSPAGGSGAGAQIFIRGVGQLDYSATQEPDVPIYLDGVYLARPIGAVFDFLDLSRVEVLRGPQGTLFGRNALGGAVQIITNLPTDEFSGRVRATVGRFERRDVEGVVNLPLTDTLSFRGAASSTNSDGYGRLIPTDTRPNDNRNTTLRGTFRWRPDTDTDVILRAERYTHRDSMSLQTLLSVVATPTPILAAYNSMLQSKGLAPITPAILRDDPYEGLSSARRPETARSWGTALDITRQFGGLTFKLITAYRELEAKTTYDFAPAIYPLINSQTDTNQKQFSQEFQVSGRALNERLNYVGGAYYFHERNVQRQNVFQRLDVAKTGNGPYDFAWMTNTGTIANTLNDQVTDSYALYGQVGYEILPRLTATLGLRASWDKKDLGSSAGTGTSFENLRGLGHVQETWSQVTPRYGLDYKVTDDVLLYATISHGFRAGGFNGRVTTPAPPVSYDEERLIDYEGGVKTQFFDRRARLNLSLFDYDYQNYQATTNQIVNGTVTVVVANAAALRIKGVELEGEFQATQGLRIGGYVSGLDPEFHNIVANTTAIRPDSQPPNAPKFTAGANVQYQWDVADWGTALARIDYAYKSKTQFFLPNFPGEAQKGYGLINARLVLSPQNQAYELSVFGSNVFDKRYRTYGQSLASSYGVVTGVYGPPAQWGVSLDVRF